MPAKSHRELDIYKLAHELAVRVHHVSLDLPKFEQYEEASQLRRSAKSIVGNIVEGYGRRRYRNEWLRFLTYAQASCDETIAHLKLLSDTGSLDRDMASKLTRDYADLGRKIYRFTRYVESSALPPREAHSEPKTRNPESETCSSEPGPRNLEPGTGNLERAPRSDS